MLRLHPLQKTASSSLPEDVGLSWIKMQNSQFPLQHQVCLHAAMFSAMMTMDQTSETVSRPQLDIYLYNSCLDHGISS